MIKGLVKFKQHCKKTPGRNHKGQFLKGHSETRGKQHGQWKGDKVGYSALHEWLRLRLGNPKVCDRCPDLKAKRYEWANISGKYKRILSDWERLCVRCHRKKDGHAKKMWATRRKNKKPKTLIGADITGTVFDEKFKWPRSRLRASLMNKKKVKI